MINWLKFKQSFEFWLLQQHSYYMNGLNGKQFVNFLRGAMIFALWVWTEIVEYLLSATLEVGVARICRVCAWSEINWSP